MVRELYEKPRAAPLETFTVGGQHPRDVLFVALCRKRSHSLEKPVSLAQVTAEFKGNRAFLERAVVHPRLRSTAAQPRTLPPGEAESVRAGTLLFAELARLMDERNARVKPQHRTKTLHLHARGEEGGRNPVAFYEKFGFRKTRTEEMPPVFPGTEALGVGMVAELDDVKRRTKELLKKTGE